jgi:hypothetical protein
MKTSLTKLGSRLAFSSAPLMAVAPNCVVWAGNNGIFGYNTASNLNDGIFNGSVSNVPGGWYTVEVRGKLGTNIVATTYLNRVGVGEVFLIAGQSNAQGLAGNQGEVGATDERVLCHNEVSWYDINIGQCDKKTPNYPSFSQIYSNGSTRSFLSKTSFNPWCYGRLGDELVRKLDVPVVFFNAAATAIPTID